jgi:hypothetical protein
MKSIVSLLAEYANVSRDGRLTVINTYNVQGVTTFPAPIAGINLAIGLIFEPEDWNYPITIAIRIVDPDGGELATLSAQPVTFQPPRPGYPASWFNALNINVTFPREGTYTFEVRADDKMLSEVPLYVGPVPR